MNPEQYPVTEALKEVWLGGCTVAVDERGMALAQCLFSSGNLCSVTSRRSQASVTVPSHRSQVTSHKSQAAEEAAAGEALVSRYQNCLRRPSQVPTQVLQ